MDIKITIPDEVKPNLAILAVDAFNEDGTLTVDDITDTHIFKLIRHIIMAELKPKFIAIRQNTMPLPSARDDVNTKLLQIKVEEVKEVEKL